MRAVKGWQFMSENSRELMTRAKNGDPQAFGELYSEVWHELYRFALYYLQNKEDAEDAVQEAAAEAYRCIKSLREAEAFRSWIFAILTRYCRHRIKTIIQQKHNTTFEELEQQGVFIEAESGQLDDKIEVWNALNILGNDERLVVLLSVVGDYTSYELSAMMKKPSGTIRSQLHRGLVKLKIMLSES
jgi:RNA polymerase sigma factor (sigma-70 family)